MINISSNIKKFRRQWKNESEKGIKAAKIAVKSEGYDLKRLLQDEVRKGQPGGKGLSPLTELAKRSRKYYGVRGSSIIREGGLNLLTNLAPRDKPPLYMLSFSIRYVIEETSKRFKMYVGWIGPKVSGSWKWIAERQQEGMTINVDEPPNPWSKLGRAGVTYREYFKMLGIPLAGHTKRLHVPGRKIIEPFWTKHRRSAMKNIKQKFEDKMKGKIVGTPPPGKF